MQHSKIVMKGITEVNLTQLYYFMQVVKTMNITKTAQQEHVAQPSISRSLRKLENELGVNLFIRQGRRLVLTQQGNYFYDAVRQSMALLNNAQTNIRNIQTADENKITFKMYQSTPLIVPFLKLMHRSYPQIQFQVIQSELENDPRPFDFQIVQDPVPNQENKLLMEEEVFLATAKKHGNAPFTPERLNHVPLIGLTDTPLAKFIKRSLASSHIEPKIVLQSGDRNLIVSLVAEDFATCLIPKKSWQSIVDLDTVSLHRIGKNGWFRQIYLSYPHGVRTKTQRKVESLLIEYCHKIL